jgi:spermidine synthase
MRSLGIVVFFASGYSALLYTQAALAGRAGLERITSIEIIEPLIGLLQRSAPDLGYDGLTGLLADPRVEHVAGDGRAFLRRTDRRFDIIEADALRPGSAYSGNLYSVEYFELLRARLRPGGLAVTWAPTDRVERTFVSDLSTSCSTAAC